MSNFNRFFWIICILVMTGCASMPTEIAASPTLTMMPQTPPTVASPTLEPDPTLQAGQSTFTFYHEELGQVILVNGGPEQGKPADDPLELWGWDGMQWSLITADKDGPAWRNWAAIAYDSARDVLVIHGGLQGTNGRFDETWEWDGDTWKKYTGQGPREREGSLMVYDSVRAKMVLFGGAENLDVKGDTWEWDGQNWMQVSETGPAARFPGGMIYDPARKEVLMFSGHFAASTGEFIDFGDLWAWDGTSWREIVLNEPTPGHRTHTALVFDPETERVLLFSGGIQTFMSDVWAWDGLEWLEIPASNMPARSGHSVAYDAKRDRFIFFGGVDRPAREAMSDTWEWDRAQWSCISNCQ